MAQVLRLTLGVLAMVGASAVVACSSSDGGTGGGAAGSGATSQGGNGQGGFGQGGNNQGGNNNGGSGGGGGGCYGDFTLGQNVVVSGSTDTLGQPCNNNNAPTNCPDGTFINFGNGECICIVMCSSLQGVSAGDNCTTDGSWKCEKIQATNASANYATVCVPTKWGLCTSGGQGGSGGGGQGGSGGGGQGGSGGGEAGSGGGSQCKGSGDDCFDDDECCSGTCDSFSCT
ncbi:MAG: hypothetical protein HY898_25780 [Deltaproteobacteria bacterium]|nr:hypothetical protein [Deltaproteobacteria bacterium]